MGTQVITRDTGRRLGVVGEVVVDIDRREVVALGLRDNPLTRFLPGLPRWMPLDRIRQVGDVILVDSVDSLAEGFNPERYSKVINCQVITESGEQLGRVLGFSFDIETGELTTLVLGALGVPLLGEGVLSTWELSVEEIVSSGPDRIIVYEGAEEKLKQLGSGLLEKLGIGGPSWEQEERERFRQTMVPVENQLASGQPGVQEQRRIQPATSRAVQLEEQDELEYVELERRRQEPLRQRRYLDEEDAFEADERGRFPTSRSAGPRSGPDSIRERRGPGAEPPSSRYEPPAPAYPGPTTAESGYSDAYDDEAYDEEPPLRRSLPLQPRQAPLRSGGDQRQPLDVEPEPFQDSPEPEPRSLERSIERSQERRQERSPEGDQGLAEENEELPPRSRNREERFSDPW
jgi:sporulation protein YlmC with PRC-barrel domain